MIGISGLSLSFSLSFSPSSKRGEKWESQQGRFPYIYFLFLSLFFSLSFSPEKAAESFIIYLFNLCTLL